MASDSSLVQIADIEGLLTGYKKATNGFVLLIVKGIGGTRNLECLRDEPIIQLMKEILKENTT